MKSKKLVKMLGVFLAVVFFAASPLSSNAEIGPYGKSDILKEPTQYGETGYPIVVSWPGRDGYFVQPNELSRFASHPDTFVGSDTGLFEFNGQVIYLSWSRQQKLALVEYIERNEEGTYMTYVLYCDAEGRIRQYTDETKPAIDAEFDAHLVQAEADVQSLYGASLLRRGAFSAFDNYHFAKVISDSLASCPPDSIRIIADATKGVTGKPLKFQSIYTDSNENKSASWWVDGVYDYKNNTVQTSGLLSTTIHELGHSMESTLNTASGGRLAEDFRAMNGGAAYSIYYYYEGGDPEIYATVPSCFKSSYSATSFSEDFADTFADALCYSTTELEELYNYDDISMEYLQKVSYVKQLFNQYAGAAILQ